MLGLDEEKPIVGNFTGTGMHGGAIYLRCDAAPENLPEQVAAAKAKAGDLEQISGYLREYAQVFSLDYDSIINSTFYVLKPNAKNPYKRLYTIN